MEASLQSYFGRAVYNFDDKYLVNFTIRRDGSSKFGENNKWGVFPAASVAWRLSNDIIDNPNINQLKIRASWGQAGNDRIGAIPHLANYLDPIIHLAIPFLMVLHPRQQVILI